MTTERKTDLIIAGPGAGKTYNMVESVVSALPYLSAARYMAVITYTNSATINIKKRLSKRIQIPNNLFIGTIHSFLNHFLVIPYSSWVDKIVNIEKVFIQCQTDEVFNKTRKGNGKISPKEAAIIKSRLTEKLNKNGYITYDQTLILANKCILEKHLSKIISNRIQFLFIDEFQDTNNHIFRIVDEIRKEGLTKIICVGDPEQFVQSFDSSIKTFGNIPILKASRNSQFRLSLNTNNRRSSKEIVDFLNNFNKRIFNGVEFQQESLSGPSGIPIRFINISSSVSNIIPKFISYCDELDIIPNERCILAKKNDLVKRIEAALENNTLSPKKEGFISPLEVIKDTLLSSIGLSQTEFQKKYETDLNTLRKYCILILKAIKSGEINNENTFGNYVTESLNLELKTGLPIKIDNFRISTNTGSFETKILVSNIHNFKGLESEAILAIAKNEEELLLWIESDMDSRDTFRDRERTDYPRLGYVAFSRAKQLLCISSLEKISDPTLDKMRKLDVKIVN
jgi:DNA helicase-2/ATP-dependent DNA helicase PcrA